VLEDVSDPLRQLPVAAALAAPEGEVDGVDDQQVGDGAVPRAAEVPLAVPGGDVAVDQRVGQAVAAAQPYVSRAL
jgi:hypothetical protein